MQLVTVPLAVPLSLTAEEWSVTEDALPAGWMVTDWSVSVPAVASKMDPAITD